MRLPLAWLHAHCAPPLDAAALAARLAMTGTEVDRIHVHGVAALERFVVGRVLRCAPHPDADRLRVCEVAVGPDEVVGIVCGAPNVAAGLVVAVARPGAVMPDGTRLKRATLRGVPSDGMILSEDELRLGEDRAGILVLDDALPAGTPLAEVLPLATEVLELEITPNRPDCLSVYGVAREVHAATGAPLGPPPWAADPGTTGAGAGEDPGVEVEVAADVDCSRFTVQRFEGVRVGPSPPWLRARLMAAGQRPIANVVDITNYVMLEVGQPLHAFDADRVAGDRLEVRRAAEGERLTTLDGVERGLTAEDVLIADGAGPTSIAGLMGGARSEVASTTTRVLLEAATWDGPRLQRTSARLGLRTEASGRFEKQLAPEQATEGQALAARLMVELCGARPVGPVVDVGGPGPAPAVLELRLARAAAVLGAPVARADAVRVLEALGFGVTGQADVLAVAVPAHRRRDVTREVDLVEELARLVALDDLPATLPPRRAASGRLTAAQRARRRVEDALVGAGLTEAVGWSFAGPQALARLGLPDAPRIRLENPMSEDQSALRTTLLGSLLDAVRHNRSRGAGDVRLFEVGAVYRPGDAATVPRLRLGAGREGAEGAGAGTAAADERLHLAALLVGAVRPASWRDGAPPEVDLFAAKGVLAAALDPLGVAWSVQPGRHPSLHPGRAADLLVGGRRVGWLGELHPTVAARWDLERVAGFELDLDAACAAARPVRPYADVPAFPSVRHDLAVAVDDDVPAARVLEVVRRAGGALLAEARVFDVFRGEQVGAGRTSLALRLAFRAPDRTLTDDEVAERRAKVVAALRTELGGELRG